MQQSLDDALYCLNTEGHFSASFLWLEFYGILRIPTTAISCLKQRLILIVQANKKYGLLMHDRLQILRFYNTKPDSTKAEINQLLDTHVQIL